MKCIGHRRDVSVLDLQRSHARRIQIDKRIAEEGLHLTRRHTGRAVDLDGRSACVVRARRRSGCREDARGLDHPERKTLASGGEPKHFAYRLVEVKGQAVV